MRTFFVPLAILSLILLVGCSDSPKAKENTQIPLEIAQIEEPKEDVNRELIAKNDVECTTRADCKGNSFCFGNKCREKQCIKDSDCNTKSPWCNVNNGLCYMKGDWDEGRYTVLEDGAYFCKLRDVILNDDKRYYQYSSKEWEGPKGQYEVTYTFGASINGDHTVKITFKKDYYNSNEKDTYEEFSAIKERESFGRIEEGDFMNGTMLIDQILIIGGSTERELKSVNIGYGCENVETLI